MRQPTASVQLYTLANELESNLDRSLETLAELGFDTVEAFDFVDRAPQIRAALDANGLAVPTAHAPLLSDELWTPHGSIPTPPPERVFAAAAVLGTTTVIDPFVTQARWQTLSDVIEIADRLNAASELAASFGLQVGYHNHAQEFVATFDGSTAFEHFLAQLDERVAIELDLFWAMIGEQDVVELTNKIGQRLLAVHVKDGKKTANPWAVGSTEVEADALIQLPAGEGSVPIADAIRANASIKYAVIEYDVAPGEVFADVAASLAFLQHEGLVA